MTRTTAMQHVDGTKTVPDLRNLFGVVNSCAHPLEHDRDLPASRHIIEVLLATAQCGAAASAHGRGLALVRQFARDAHGRRHIRSRARQGAIVRLNLPVLLSMATGEVAAPQRNSAKKLETDHDHRQPLAA